MLELSLFFLPLAASAASSIIAFSTSVSSLSAKLIVLFLAVQNLKMALKKANILYNIGWLKGFFI